MHCFLNVCFEKVRMLNCNQKSRQHTGRTFPFTCLDFALILSKIFKIKPNMRIGQIVFSPIVKIQLQLGDVDIFETKRSSKGVGSTGLE